MSPIIGSDDSEIFLRENLVDTYVMLVVELSSTPFWNRWSTAMDIALALSSKDLNPQHIPSRNKHPIFNSNPETTKHCNAKVTKHNATSLLKLNMFTCLLFHQDSLWKETSMCLEHLTEALWRYSKTRCFYKPSVVLFIILS